MTCRLCKLDVPLIEAHIIPKPFFRAYGDGRRAPKLLSNSAGVRPKRVRTGFYDSGILCGPCDGRIGIWDQYGVDLLIRQLGAFQPFPSSTAPIGFILPTFSYALLRLFVLSVLWRAHITTHEAFKAVKLGPYAIRLERMIAEADPGDPGEFCTVLSGFTVGGRFPGIGVPIMDPFRERWAGVNAYRLSLGVITAYVKTDKAHLPDTLGRMSLKPNAPLYLLERDFPSSSEARVMRAVARAPQNSRAFNNTKDSSSRNYT
ncbi:hypothetical protein BH09GEM1_BH09GEM1_37980 [soil metagenome]